MEQRKRKATSPRERNICGEPLREPVNCKNDRIMVREGLRPPKFYLNRQLFVKSKEERTLLKRIKYKKKFEGSKPLDTNRPLCNNKLSVHLINFKKQKDFKTTYSFYCTENEVWPIINNFFNRKSIKSIRYKEKKIA